MTNEMENHMSIRRFEQILGTRRPLRRRDAIAALGAGIGLGALWGSSARLRIGARSLLSPHPADAAACVLATEETEGPYYLSNEPFRRAISEGRPGLPLIVGLRIVEAASCAPVANATVEIWHADAGGDYSGFNGASNATFMRGQQRSNPAGRVSFKTVYPGWYRGRTTHIHVKVHVAGTTVHTGQLYFDDAITDAVYAQAPYASRGERDQTNDSDDLYDAASQLALLDRGANRGYRARLTLRVAG